RILDKGVPTTFPSWKFLISFSVIALFRPVPVTFVKSTCKSFANFLKRGAIRTKLDCPVFVDFSADSLIASVSASSNCFVSSLITPGVSPPLATSHVSLYFSLIYRLIPPQFHLLPSLFVLLLTHLLLQPNLLLVYAKI